MTDRAQRKDSDLVDARAQLEVMKLQVHILKETLKEKEKEIEKEKKLGSEWKREAFKKVREQNHATGEKILQSQEYKELLGRNSELEKENEELKIKLKKEQEASAKKQEEEKERSSQELQLIRLESEDKLNQKIRELEASQEAPKQLQKRIEELSQENERLQEDQEKTKNLELKIEKLLEENAVLREHAEDMQESLHQEENNRKGKESKKKEEEPFWAKMGLPENQTCIEYFACCNSQMKGGWLYITEEYVVFETSLKSLQRSERCTIKIENIVQIDKRRILSKWIPGKGRSLLIRTNDTEYTFRSFIQRNEAVLLILRQSQKLGCTIATTIEDKPVNFLENDSPRPLSGSDIGLHPEILGTDTPPRPVIIEE